jgi:hypothetical protein
MKNIFSTGLLTLIILLGTEYSYSQQINAVIPDTGSQGMTFPIVITGTDTYWSASPYVAVYFDSIGVGANNVVIVNDTTLHANIIIYPKASLGFHKCITSDAFLNIITKDSAFFVRLSAPGTPALIQPCNHCFNINTNPLFKWDTNGYVNTYRIQIFSDSLLTMLVKDTSGITTYGYQLPNILSLSTKYFWRVKAYNSMGQSGWSDVWDFYTRTTGISLLGNTIPDEFKLFDSYPNPFNSSTKIRFQVPKTTNTRLIIYNIQGKEISVLVNQNLNAGKYEINFDGTQLSSGIYFYKLITNDYSDTKKFVIIK